jgi:hypothetical protein
MSQRRLRDLRAAQHAGEFVDALLLVQTFRQMPKWGGGMGERAAEQGEI